MITQRLEIMARVGDPDQIESKRKATTAFFPYAVWQERDGECRMVDAFLAVAKASRSGEFMWKAIGPFVTTLFEEASSPNRVITFVSPYVRWDTWNFNKNAVTRWAEAASAIPYTDMVGRCVVEALLEIAFINSLRPHVPVGIWAWLKKQPPLPPVCFGRFKGTTRGVVRGVRALGNVEILKSYLLLVWSEWDCVDLGGFTEMCTSIREDFSGIGMGRHRHGLVVRLDHLLRQLSWGLGYIRQHNPHCGDDSVWIAKSQYGKLKQLLLEMDKEALGILTRMPPALLNPFDLLTPRGCTQIPARRSSVPSLSHVHSCTSAALASHLPTPQFVRSRSPSPVTASFTPFSRSPTGRHMYGKWPPFTSLMGG